LINLIDDSCGNSADKEISDFNPVVASLKVGQAVSQFPTVQINQIVINNFKETTKTTAKAENKEELQE